MWLNNSAYTNKRHSQESSKASGKNDQWKKKGKTISTHCCTNSGGTFMPLM